MNRARATRFGCDARIEHGADDIGNIDIATRTGGREF
jgi:hypothetical protein